MTATAGPFIYLSYQRRHRTVGERLRAALSATESGRQIFDYSESEGGSADRWEHEARRAFQAADVFLILGDGLRQEDLSAVQRGLVRDARDDGRQVIFVVVDGRREEVGRTRLESNQAVTVLREQHWDDDVVRLEALVFTATVPSLRVDMLPPRLDTEVGRTETRVVMNGLQPGSVVAITGPPGSGKTVLAQAVARRVADRFPDGVLWAGLDLHSPAAAIRKLLRELNLPGQSDDPAVLVRLLLDALQRKRLLVVLDDGMAVEAIAPLLTPGTTSAVLLTGRSGMMPPRPGVRTIQLGRLSDETALELLRKTMGASAIDADPASAEKLVDLADGSPLILSIAGSQASREGDSSLAPILEQLEGSGVSAGHLLLRRVYADLPDTRQRLFRLLGVLSTPVFETGLAAAIVESDVAEDLRALADASLIDLTGPDRYHFSELTLRFAAQELRDSESEEEQRAAVLRMVRWMAVSTAFEPEMPITRDFWTADDTLGYAPYADAIAAFVRHRGTRPPLTIGVTAPWGAGKTSLMRMVQERLDPRADRDRWASTRLRLSEQARHMLSPGRGDADGPVTNRELLERTGEPVPETEGLDVQPPHSRRLPDDEWRPTVWFNPWMYQSGEQIWAGLAYEIITQVTDRLAPADRERFWLALNLRRVDRQALRRRIYQQVVERFLPWALWLGLAVALALIGLLVAVVVPPAAHVLRMVAAGLSSAGGATFVVGAGLTTVRFLRSRAAGSFDPLLRVPNPIKPGSGAKGAFAELFPDPGYETKLGFLHLVQTDMRRVLDLIATQRRPLVVFVDDLDRCSPGAVVQVIEAINLFLAGEFPNCVFVVAMEPAVVAAHVEAVYKDLAAHPGAQPAVSTLGWRFLEKIVQLPLSLPPPDRARQTGGYLDALLDHRPAPAVARAAVTVTDPAVKEPARASGPAATAPSIPGPGASDDAGRAEWVRALETAIRRRSPTTETLAAAALEAQEEVLPGAAGDLRPETSEAANRVLVELYSDDEARDAILTGVPGLASDNPREIKRFVNLFRFYRFIAQQQQLRGLPAVSGAEIAKLSVLAIRWPHLLAVLARGNLTQWEQGGGVDGIALPASLLSFLKTDPPIGAAAERLL